MPKASTKKPTLNSMKQAAVALGIPLRHLKIIKELYPDGFASNNGVKVKEVTDFYNKNKHLIEEKEGESLETLHKQKLTNEVIIQELKIQEMKRETVLIKEVEEFMSTFGIELSATLKSKLIKELPPRITGLPEEEVTKYLKDYYNEIVTLFNKDMTEWKARQ